MVINRRKITEAIRNCILLACEEPMADYVGVEIDSEGRIAYPRWCGDSFSLEAPNAVVIHYEQRTCYDEALDDYLDDDPSPAAYKNAAWDYTNTVLEEMLEPYEVVTVDDDGEGLTRLEVTERMLACIGIELEPATPATAE